MRVIEVVADFETKSRLILGKTSMKRGSHNSVDDPAPGGTNCYKYSAHPSTEVLCFAYSVDGWPEEVWRPHWIGGFFSAAFPFAAEWPDVKLFAQNAEFEWAIWNYCCVPKYGWPKLERHQIECLAARASYYGLPRKLDTIGQTLALGSMAKDREGHLNMLRLSKPQGAKAHGCELVGGKFDDTPARHQRNEAYCIQDVITERIVRRTCPPLPPKLGELWHVHREINERGVPVDVDLCKTAVRLVNMENARLGQRLHEITGIDGVTPDDTAKLKAWLGERGTITPDWPRTKPTKHHPRGQPVLNKEVVPAALGGEYGELPGDVKEVLEIRQMSSDAAVAKYSAILRYEQEGRCRGCHAFYTAGTGRFSGVGVQVQNQKRLEADEDWLKDRLELADLLSTGFPDDEAAVQLERRGGVIPTLGGMVRLAVCAKPGHVLIVVDWSAIEMRMLHWLAGDAGTLEQIRAYDNGQGEEPYKLAAAEMFGVKASEVTKAQRQQGKVRVLGCGYMTGANKYRAFAAGYGIDLPMDVAQEHVQGYRRSYPLVKRFWYALGKAAVNAVKRGGRHQVGYLEYYMTGHTLCCRLPSGRELKYYDAAIIDGMYGEEVEAIDVQKTRTGGAARRRPISMPILTENADSGACFDIMTEAHLKAHAEGLPVVLHVHDELCLESPESKADEHLRTLKDIMTDVPAWARGLPLAVSGGFHRRYTK